MSNFEVNVRKPGSSVVTSTTAKQLQLMLVHYENHKFLAKRSFHGHHYILYRSYTDAVHNRPVLCVRASDASMDYGYWHYMILTSDEKARVRRQLPAGCMLSRPTPRRSPQPKVRTHKPVQTFQQLQQSLRRCKDKYGADSHKYLEIFHSKHTSLFAFGKPMGKHIRCHLKMLNGTDLNLHSRILAVSPKAELKAGVYVHILCVDARAPRTSVEEYLKDYMRARIVILQHHGVVPVQHYGLNTITLSWHEGRCAMPDSVVLALCAILYERRCSRDIVGNCVLNLPRDVVLE